MNAEGLRRAQDGIKREWRRNAATVAAPRCLGVEKTRRLNAVTAFNTRRPRKDNPSPHGSNVIDSGCHARTRVD
jgi:hypothetical protein